MAKHKYGAIIKQLRERVRSGDLNPGDKIPGERQLAEEMDVSFMTARRAVEFLVREGLLERRGRAGTFVHMSGGRMLSANSLNIVLAHVGVESVIFPLVTTIRDFARRRGWKDNLMQVSGVNLQVFGELIAGENPTIILAHEAMLESLRGMLQESGSPAVLIGNRMDQFGIPSVMADNDAAMRIAVRHLREMGHRKIGFVAVENNNNIFQERVRAWRDEQKDIPGRDLDRRLVLIRLNDEECRIQAARAAMRQFIANGQCDVTACVAMSDDIAVGIQSVCRENDDPRIRELSLIGCGKTSLADIAYPTLTSVDLGIEAHVQKAFDLLELAIDNELGDERFFSIEPTLSLRESVRRCEDL